MSRMTAEARQSILDVLQEGVAPAVFRTWCRNLHIEEVSDNAFEVPVPNSFCRDWLEREIRRPLEEAFRTVYGRVPELTFKISDVPEAMAMFAGPMEATSAPSIVAPPPPAPAPMPIRASISEPGSLELNPHYTFDTFVVGPTNRIAHAAALSVSESPALAYNPFFIHGGVGLGKTHLLQATCHAIRARNPHARILYLSCETFVNEYIGALQKGRIESFRQRMRGSDVLVIDDVHFLAGKESSQEEFFHTFNTLHLAQRQIILSSDSGPKDIRSLKEQLVSRFLAGFEARVDMPSFEMRVAILRRKAELKSRGIPEEVLSYVAANVETNIRELEGAINKLIAYATLSNRPIDMALAREALRETVAGTGARMGQARIREVVARYFGHRDTELRSKTWTKSVSKARQVAMYLIKELTSHSYAEIGGFFGGKDYSTVIYGVNRIAKLAHSDEKLRVELDELRRILKTAE